MHIPHLDPISIPLTQSCLIEASAGTGKTYTMANLYLRLILGVGCEPLSVEQILVVTFTKAATQELRERIREKLKTVSQLFEAHHQHANEVLSSDSFLLSLYQQVEARFYESLLRLRIAEKEIDLASIFTIDSFVQRMLFQFAFDSGIRFDIELQTDEEKLQLRLCEETWREMFYPMGELETAFVADTLMSPQILFKQIKRYLSGDIPSLSELQQHQIQVDFCQLLAEKTAYIAEMKTFWQSKGQEIIHLIEQEITKTYKPKIPKSLARNSYRKDVVEKAKNILNEWADSQDLLLPEDKWERFTQSFIMSKVEKEGEPLVHSLFSECETYFTEYQTYPSEKTFKAILQFQFLQRVREKLAAYKQTHREKSFEDITHFFHQALLGSQGEQLANQIRQLYPFAMIDEFQDTNQIQYDIFSRIFMPLSQPHQGFIMIGDPKQSIYQFRGADIFTYLKASQQVDAKYTLDRNWRSLPDVVNGTNQLFQFPPESAHFPFIYPGIHFQVVKTKPTVEKLVGNATQYFLQETFNQEMAAEWCAYHIQQQLKQAEQYQFGVKADEEGSLLTPFQARDITILVRNHDQASLIRKALFKRQIRSVFLAEKRSVYQSDEAKDLLLILKAALNPTHTSSLLNALGTALWGLTAQEIFHLKNDEAEWERQVEHFITFQQIWQQQGILPMLHRIFLQQEIIKRLNGKPNAERRITDLLHLSELLQEAMITVENESALVRWYQQQLNNPNRWVDEQKLRLESEDALIKIVTIHGSKGLEYPVVWLPFIGQAVASAKSSSLSIYRTETGELAWAFGQLSDEIKALINQSEYAEELRLLYVAMTRAKYQTNVILPEQFQGWNAMYALLSNGELDALNTKIYLAQKAIPHQQYFLTSSPPEDPWQMATPILPHCQARIFNGNIEVKGGITSFTALQEQNSFLHAFRTREPFVTFNDNAQDYDRQLEIQMQENHDEEENPYSPYQFPHGVKVGNLLHKVLENWDFSQPLDFSVISQMTVILDLTEEWIEPVSNWFEKVVTTSVSDQGFCLRDIPPTARLNEWQFYLRLRNENALPQLNRLLKQYSHLTELPDLQLRQLEGFVRGFIDCIAQVNGKYYIIDYKSNFLGYFAQDYQYDKLEKVMKQYRYDLQYLLYTLALHRYLRSRLGENYCYERDVGGVAYLFLRAMNGEDHQGVFFDKPNAILIDAMDQLFG